MPGYKHKPQKQKSSPVGLNELMGMMLRRQRDELVMGTRRDGSPVVRKSRRGAITEKQVSGVRKPPTKVYRVEKKRVIRIKKD